MTNINCLHWAQNCHRHKFNADISITFCRQSYQTKPTASSALISMHFINFLHKFIIILSSKQCENVKCCFLGGENEFNKCSGSSYAFCQTAGEIQHNSRKAVTRSLCQRRLSAEPPPAPCVFFYPPSPSCPVGRLCIRQALCGKQWDWSFVIVIIFISPPTPPLHVSCPRPPAFVFVFFFGSPPPPHREVSGLH